jgi:endo-1,4-beta-D-glucanase Y
VGRQWRLFTATALAVVVALGAVVVAVWRTRADSADPASRAVAAAEAFLDEYVDPEGRVVRHDQGGDTVSEGQAYGMLIAAGLSDEERFRAIWTWTEAELQRDDGLLAWRWADGAVADPSPAADADLIAAGALVLAGERFDDPALVVDGRALSTAVLEHEVAAFGPADVLLAGPWAAPWRVVNPSYLVVPVMSRLHDAGEWGWRDVAASSRRLLDQVTATAPHLVPDWATVAADGSSLEARGAPGGGEVTAGFEAGRAYVQLAVDCDAGGRELAARAWPFFAAEAADGGTVNAAYRLDGRGATTATHPLALVAAAASARAAGDVAASRGLLDRADRLLARTPTYYGAAWVAIARLWLDTDLLGGCAP